jgi:LmbE family N-acetylglucosaminyl deacetylase
MTAVLPSLHSALVVIADPDDESFGLGGVLDHLAIQGVRVRVLCLTRGEASTLGDVEEELQGAHDRIVLRPPALPTGNQGGS